MTETRDGKTYYTVIAIHTHGFNDTTPNQYNSGARVTTNLIHFYYNNPYLEW